MRVSGFGGGGGGGGSRRSLVLDVCKVMVGDEPWTTGET